MAERVSEEEVERPAKFWAIDDEQEELIHCTPEAAIAAQIAELRDLGLSTEGWEPGQRVTLYGFAPIPHETDAERLLEAALEQLDEDHGDPGADGTDPTEKMIEAARAFAAVIDAEYVPWACEVVEVREFEVPCAAVREGA